MTNEQTTALERLARHGRLTPDAVVCAAEPEDSPLHSLFTWDDSVAAAKWRLEEARTIIVSIKVKVVIEATEHTVVRYVRDPNVAADEQGYVDWTTLKRGSPATLDILRYELDRLEAIVDRVGSLVNALDGHRAVSMRPAFDRVARSARLLRSRAAV